jgi:hypothetical protein
VRTGGGGLATAMPLMERREDDIGGCSDLDSRWPVRLALGRCHAGTGSAAVVRLLPEAVVWSKLLLLEHRPAPALTHPAAIISAAHLYRGAGPPAGAGVIDVYRSRVARTQGEVKSGESFFKKPGSRPAPDHIVFTFTLKYSCG